MKGTSFRTEALLIRQRFDAGMKRIGNGTGKFRAEVPNKDNPFIQKKQSTRSADSPMQSCKEYHRQHEKTCLSS